MSLEQLFGSSELSLVVPDTSLEFPPESSVDEWLGRVKIGKVERKQAFFDEQLQSLLLLRIQHPAPDVPADPTSPPVLLLEFLNYLQVSLEASYISPLPAPSQEPTWSSKLSAPPRAASLKPPPSGQLSAHHPSIFPPATPNPVPATGDQDKQYAASDGAFLAAVIWGAGNPEQSKDAFSLLWSEKEKVWVAIYRLALTVSFIKTANFANPLLCLTVATTLRDKPIVSSDKHPLARFLSTLGVAAPESPTLLTDKTDDQADETLLDGLEEINLLEGLLAGPDFAKVGSEKLNVPSLRLGAVSRQKLFSLPPVLADTPVQPSPSPMTAVRKTHPTLRKSYRRTLHTISTFQLRMRTVFVPYVLLPGTEGTVSDLDESEKERERREAGSAERTVVLCIEIKNSGGDESRNGIGFMVESIEIKIGGEGARTTLVGWGEGGLSADAAKSTFPLKLGPFAQVNLLYAVTFLRSPEELDSFSFADPDGKMRTELRRGVSINVNGKPYTPLTPSARALLTEPDAITLPTRTFSSVWSTVLDLDANPAPVLEAFDLTDPVGGYPTALPEPASPFPMYALGSSRMGTPATATYQMYSPGTTPQSSVFAGSRKFPLTPGGYFQAKVFKNTGTMRTPTRPSSAIPPHLREQPSLPSSARSSTYLPSGSLVGTMQYLRSPTTYSAPVQPLLPPHSPLPGRQDSMPFSPGYDDNYTPGPNAGSYDAVPPTPAYPAFPMKSTLPPSPMSQGPIASQSQNNVGPSVEVRRDRSSLPPALAGGPPTPLPHVTAAFGEQRMLNKLQNSGATGENIVVSVGLLPGGGSEGGGAEGLFGHEKIYPLDSFTLDIFVFNQSTWTRRFEVTCPEKRRRRRGGAQTGVYGGGGEIARKMGYPGVLPMNKRVRIGPLRPSACQSVRMEFLAVSPGVHSIDTLTLTDIETGFSMNLRAVLDVVVHDPND
ncbi:hypothetical protein EST38_g13460 [Candolleomyces aberdarensis]|uniref:Trafficking protein particle complex II-specific subunit 65 IgD3 domain-containing protein n=1 Tax=Candolleomyces aberdarensis TaxID=2316362 RepID=A0A4Q2D260_9AGAR|nr:hypothetical protein EST38_g13460 [Candolleomyces aberdarensis]